MADNKQIAQDVLEAVGGAANIREATHCMTRLRLYLKDDTIPNDDEVKAIKGVMTVVRGGQQYMVVIGTNVPKVYDEFCKLADVTAQEAVEDEAAAAADGALKKKLTPKEVFNNILGYMAGCMTPMIPVLLAGGLISALNSIFGPGLLNLYSAESDIYILFDFVYDAAFYFMPILVGVNAAKQLGVSPMLGGFWGCILLSPDFMAYATSGEPFTVFGIPAVTSSYSQTVIPAMISVYFFSLVYKLIKKYMPDVLTTVFTPLLSVLICLPFILCLLAPLGTIVGNGISSGLLWFGNATGFFGIALIAALWEYLVMSGMHLALMMPMLSSFFETGILTGPLLSGNFATWACFGVALGAALRLRKVNRDESADDIGAFISGIVGGVTEPTIYGICLQHARCFVALSIGAFIGGCYCGITGVTGYVMTSANFLSLLGFVGGSTANLVNGIVACVISCVAAAVLTYFFGFTKDELEAA